MYVPRAVDTGRGEEKREAGEGGKVSLKRADGGIVGKGTTALLVRGPGKGERRIWSYPPQWVRTPRPGQLADPELFQISLTPRQLVTRFARPSTHIAIPLASQLASTRRGTGGGGKAHLGNPDSWSPIRHFFPTSRSFSRNTLKRPLHPCKHRRSLPLGANTGLPYRIIPHLAGI